MYCTFFSPLTVKMTSAASRPSGSSPSWAHLDRAVEQRVGVDYDLRVLQDRRHDGALEPLGPHVARQCERDLLLELFGADARDDILHGCALDDVGGRHDFTSDRASSWSATCCMAAVSAM
jgi:hypothetical protein